MDDDRDVLTMDAESYIRTTRSKRVFSAWTGIRVAPHNPTLDFKDLLKKAVEIGNTQDDDPYLEERDHAPPPMSTSTEDSRSGSHVPEIAPSTAPILAIGESPPLPANQPRPPSNAWPLSSTQGTPPSSATRTTTCNLPAVYKESPLLSAESSKAPSNAKPLLLTPRPPVTPDEPQTPLSYKEAQKEARKSRNKERTRASKKRKHEERRTEDLGHYCPKAALQDRHIDFSRKIECVLGLDNSRVASKAFVGVNDRSRCRRTYALEELVGEGSRYKFALQRWNGKDTIPIIFNNQVVALLGGHPHDSGWDSVNTECSEALEACIPRCAMPQGSNLHRRGRFTALHCGVSHGGGQKNPGNLRNSKANEDVLRELNEMRCFKRIAGFTNSLMANWSPDLYNYYVTRLRSLHNNDPSLERIFPSSVFSATTYNFGPQTQCFKHTDFANLPFGWCAVTALGTFDPNVGGHLVLWDFHLVVEFPPGSTILFPSAVIAHSNVPIPLGAKRYSFTQYSAGGLFRWTENQFLTATKYYRTLNKEELTEVQWKNATRWEYGLSLFRTVSTVAS